jgi:hypothetical protein
MAYTAPTGVAGAEPPPERPSLAATHPQLFSRGNDILQSIMQIMSITPTEEGISAIVEGLPGFLDKVGDFVRDTLSSRGPNDSVAYWVEQTFKAVRRIEQTPRTKPGDNTIPTTPRKPTWAAVTARQMLQPIETPRMLSDDVASLRQIKVRITDLTERKNLWTTANRTIVEKVVEKGNGNGVVGVKKLPSGDILIQLKEQAGKEKLVRSQQWLEQVAPSAKLVPDLFPVMVHGVRMSNINIADQRQTNRKLEEQNRTLHPNLKIVRTTWARGAGAGGKARASLLVFVASPEVANKVITEGLVEGGEVKLTDRFYTGCGLVQCFKCCSYGHIAKHCRIEARCGHCAGLHETRNCNDKTKSVCPCCKARGTPEHNHKAWSELCASRRDVRTQIAFRFANRPLLFPTTAKPDVRDPVELQNITRRRGRPPKSATLQQEDESSETSSRVTKRARQSTLSFVTPGDRMDE